MPATVNHVLTATTPDQTQYEIRPSHWNSTHAVTLSAQGSEIVGAFSNANGLSFGTNAQGAITGSYTVPNTAGLLSAVQVSGTNGSSVAATDLVFGAANGLSLGVSTGAQAATVTGSYTVPNTSQLAGTNSAFSGTNISASITLNTSGLSLALSAVGGGAFSAGVSTGGNTAGATGITGTQLVLAGGNNITLSQTTGVAGATVTIQAGTAANAAVNVTAGGSSVNASTLDFSNANGVTFGLSTAGGVGTITASVSQSVQTQASGNIGGTGFATTTTNGSVIVGTNNTAGVTLAVPPYITTAPSTAGLISAVAVSGGAGNSVNATGLTFVNANGLTLGVSTAASAATVTGSYTVQDVHATLTALK